MRAWDSALSEGWGQFFTPLSIETSVGKQNLNYATTEGIFRIIQSIPSPKPNPFKRWLAKVGYERIQEIEEPELAYKSLNSSQPASVIEKTSFLFPQCTIRYAIYRINV